MNNLEDTQIQTDTEASILDSTIVTEVKISYKATPFQEKLAQFSYFVLICMLFILPLSFGGVYPKMLLTCQFIIFVLISMFCLFGHQLLFPPFINAKTNTTKTYIIYCLIVFAAYTIFQYYLQSFSNSYHPIFNQTSNIADSSGRLIVTLNVLFFAATFALLCFLFTHYKKASDNTFKYIRLCGFIVSLIALSHWLSDNGKLFWVIEPENVFTGKRARWPFVNANHLAHFLLPILFLTIVHSKLQFQKILASYERKTKATRRSLAHFLSSMRIQSAFFHFIFTCLVSSCIFLAIVASLSRGAWLGLLCASVLFYCLHRFYVKAKVKDPVAVVDTSADTLDLEKQLPVVKRIKKRKTNISFNKDSIKSFLVKSLPVIIFIVLICFYTFVSKQGTELLEKRVEYSLIASKDDIRWQLYSDSFAMLQNNPFFGVGLASWPHVYPRYMNPQLSGVNPEYLHSDPYQLLLEVGIIGVLPFIVLVVLTLRLFIKRMPLISKETKLRTIALVCGLFAFCLSSFLDFPFRIPALLFYVCVYLALLCHVLDEVKE